MIAQILAIIAAAFGGTAILFYVIRFVVSWLQTKKAISPMAAKNTASEKELLDKLVKDIRANTDNWFMHDRVGMGHLLANNKRNIGITYHESDRLTILLNLDATTDFKEHEENTVKISIRGDHVKKFLTEAEQLIDKRGNELRFFGDEFDKRI